LQPPLIESFFNRVLFDLERWNILRFAFYLCCRTKGALSLLASQLWNSIQPASEGKYLVEIRTFTRLLIYPFKVSDLNQYIQENPGKLSRNLVLVGSRNRAAIKKLVKNSSLDELHLFHIIFIEILRRNLLFISIFRRHGLRTFIASKLILRGMLKSQSNNIQVSTLAYIKALSWIVMRNSIGDFNKFVEKKHVAVVGGAPSEAIMGADIDSYDLVARLNIDKISNDLVPLLGSRVDIVYFRGERSLYLLEKFGVKYFESLDSKWIVFKLPIVMSKVDYMLKRLCLSAESAFPFGHLNAVQSAALDLLACNVREVMVFNTDFNLSGGSMPGYRPKSMEAVDYQLIFGSHPPHIQFLVTKCLSNSGFLKGDSTLQSLLELSYSQFVKNFNARWGA
jgi:hypothetical protein